MKILDALKNKFSVSGSNIAEVIDKIPNDIPAIPDDIEDGAVPTYDATEEKVDWHVPQGGGGGDIFMVKFTADTSYQNITSDKTKEEIVNAYQNGKMPVAKLSTSMSNTTVSEVTLTTFVTVWDDTNPPVVSFTGMTSDGFEMMSTIYILMTASGISCYTKQIDISK